MTTEQAAAFLREHFAGKTIKTAKVNGDDWIMIVFTDGSILDVQRDIGWDMATALES